MLRVIKEAVIKPRFSHVCSHVSTLCVCVCMSSDLRSMPPSREALRHSGGDSLLFTSAMVTLYLEVELSSDSRPGTEQNKSVGFTTHVPPAHKHNTPVTATFRIYRCLSCELLSTAPCYTSLRSFISQKLDLQAHSHGKTWP